MAKKTLPRAADPFPGTALPNEAPIEDPDKIREILLQAANQLYRINLKLTGSDILFKARLVGWDPKSIAIEVGLSPEDIQMFKQFAADLKTQETLLVIFVGNRYMLGAKTDFYECDQTAIKFRIPKKVIKLQRRKSVRWTIPDGYSLSIEIGSIESASHRVQRKLFDLSEGGLSFFILSPREAALYREGSILKNCVFKIRNQELKADLKICNHALLNRGSKGVGTKVGAEFVKISEDDRDFIAQFVHSQISQMLS